MSAHTELEALLGRPAVTPMLAVCPVPGCITIKQIDTDKPKETWQDRHSNGTDTVPGGLQANQDARRRA